MQNGDRELLIRIDERVERLGHDIKNIHIKLDNNFVTKDMCARGMEEFRGVKKIITWATRTTLVSIVGGILALLAMHFKKLL